MSAQLNGDLFPVDGRRAEMPDERYTTRTTLELCKRLAGVDAFDLDVAACDEAHCAPRYFTIATNGLERPWDADRVWCNPPYSDLGPWVTKAWDAIRYSEPSLIAMLIPANRAEQPFWQEHVEPYRDAFGKLLTTHHLPGRVQFGFPGNPDATGWKSSPPFGCVLLVWRRG